MMQVLNPIETITCKLNINLEGVAAAEQVLQDGENKVLNTLLNYLYDNNYISLSTSTNSVNKNVEICARICVRKE